MENCVVVFFSFLLRVSCPTPDLNGELNVRESCSVGQNACFEQKNSMRDAFAQLRSTHPNASSSHESLTLEPGIRFKPLFRSGVSSEVSCAAAEQRLQWLAALGAMRKDGAPLRL